MRRYLAAYVVLLVLALGAAFGLAANAGSQAQLPESSPFLTACSFAAALGAEAELGVSNCRRVSEEVVGNVAKVQVSVRVEGQGRFLVTVFLFRGEWGLHAAEVELQ